MQQHRNKVDNEREVKYEGINLMIIGMGMEGMNNLQQVGKYESCKCGNKGITLVEFGKNAYAATWS